MSWSIDESDLLFVPISLESESPNLLCNETVLLTYYVAVSHRIKKCSLAMVYMSHYRDHRSPLSYVSW